MEKTKQSKFLGISLIIAAIIIAVGMVISGMMNRYTFYIDTPIIYVEDSFTGNIDIYKLESNGNGSLNSIPYGEIEK